MNILKAFAKDKSPGPDGWTVEFFLHYFDLVGEDLLGMVEESRRKGEVIKALNYNFLVLIPKVNKSLTFGDFRPISLCNLCYKIIAKILENRLRPILSHGLLEEQLGFLQRRQNMDAVDTAHEFPYSIKKKNLKERILKLDLKKAYNYINWDFLRLVLFQAGFGLLVMNWIMRCVTSVTYAMLVNGETSKFFHRGKGLRKGCPLSPLLFILVMEGLSILLKKGNITRKLIGVKVAIIVNILHLFFVDDVLIMTRENLQEWKEIEGILETFVSATGLEINIANSSFHFAGIDENSLAPFRDLFPYNFFTLDAGFRYLGCFLKSSFYKSED